jgi:hypothetical protein
MASCLTLRRRRNQLGGDRQNQIPFLVWLLRNPESCFALPGCIDLHGHDCLHVLLLKLASQLLYPAKHRSVLDHLISFDLGYRNGKGLAFRGLNKLDHRSFHELPVGRLQQQPGLDPMALRLLKCVERLW